ncbi:uncharacterized protein METZ01_LOCUS433383, partial [marine metagenome]
ADDPNTANDVNDSDCCIGCVNGDGVDNSPDGTTENFGISDNHLSTTMDDDITTQAMVKVVVYDKGDYYGNGVAPNEDQSDNVWTMADHRLHKDLSAAWHLFGPALEQYDNTISFGLGGGSDGNDTDDSWWSDYGHSLGDWGSNWIIYTANGQFDNISSYQGTGYYLALATQRTMIVTGTPATIDADASGISAQPRTADGGMTCVEGELCSDTSLDVEADWTLSQGWNLVSNPLVNMVSKYHFEVCEISSGTCKTWDESVNSGWIA